MKDRALLVIDMQKGSFTVDTPRFDADDVIKKINLLSKAFREKDLPVIFIQHNGSSQSIFLPNTHAWELLSELDVFPEDIIVEKYANDIFYRSELKKVLESRGITSLFITGCATDFCVEATVQSALAKDYNLVVVKDAHTTADRPHIKAQKVVEHYNWVWQHMIPTLGSIKVLSFDEIENDLTIDIH